MSDQRSEAAGTPSECLVCPLCMGIAALRQSRPEAVEHVLKAGVELMAAFRALVEPTHGNGHRAAGTAGSGGLRRIDIG